MMPGNPHGFQVRPGMRRGLSTATPIPTRLVSNEEFPPIPQTAAQRRVEERILADAARLAPRVGLSRRDFLSRSGGMAVSLLAMNEVFSSYFPKDPPARTTFQAAGLVAGARVEIEAIATL